jgi:hypothetical protein
MNFLSALQGELETNHFAQICRMAEMLQAQFDENQSIPWTGRK